VPSWSEAVERKLSQSSQPMSRRTALMGPMGRYVRRSRYRVIVVGSAHSHGGGSANKAGDSLVADFARPGRRACAVDVQDAISSECEPTGCVSRCGSVASNVGDIIGRRHLFAMREYRDRLEALESRVGLRLRDGAGSNRHKLALVLRRSGAKPVKNIA